MLKTILNLEGTQQLSSKDLKSISGGQFVPKICYTRDIGEPCRRGTFPNGENECCWRVN